MNQSHGSIANLTKVILAVSHDPAKASSTTGINSSLQVGVQCPCLTVIEQDRDHQRLEDLNPYSSAQALTTLDTRFERVYKGVGQANPP